MTLKLGFIGIVTRDMGSSLAFYRALGVAIEEGQDSAPHVDAKLDDGTTLAWDTVAAIRGFDPTYEPGSGGHRIALAFDKGSPAEVDAAFTALVEAGYAAHVEPTSLRNSRVRCAWSAKPATAAASADLAPRFRRCRALAARWMRTRVAYP